MAAGAGRHRTLSVNDSNSDLQDRDFHYLFGERLNNTFDPAIYSQYRVDIAADLDKHTTFFTQLVADPWSYVGKTSETIIRDRVPSDTAQFFQKYLGPNNSTVSQIVRTPSRDKIIIPDLEAHGGKTQNFSTRGFLFSGGFQREFTAPTQDITYEFRPVRKMWVDYDLDEWHVRVFPLADQNQAMTTDDPLHLSNNKDFWQHSAWLDEWRPIQIFDDFFAGTAIRRGRYDIADAFIAKDSSGNYVTLLRGVAAEADFDRTYVGAMVASRYGLWDEYQDFNNIPGVFRIKHQLTPDLMVGGLYTFRVGLVEHDPDAYNQVFSFDTKYMFNETDHIYGQWAFSRNDIDRLSSFQSSHEGDAFRVGFLKDVTDPRGAVTEFRGDFAWMDTKFQPTLSKYLSTRDDEFWGNFITFANIPDDVEPFKIGTGLDRGRYVSRFAIETHAPNVGIDHLLDVRHVRDTDSDSFIENVLRSEFDWRFAPQWLLKTFYRWHQLPDTQTDVEPFLASISAGIPAFQPQVFSRQDEDPELKGIRLKNFDIDEGLDPSRQTWGVGLQHELNHQWTLEGSYSRSNDIQDFPRGIQNAEFLESVLADSEDPNIKLDRVQPFLFGQYAYGLPPYNYFSIVKERITYRNNLENECCEFI